MHTLHIGTGSLKEKNALFGNAVIVFALKPTSQQVSRKKWFIVQITSSIDALLKLSYATHLFRIFTVNTPILASFVLKVVWPTFMSLRPTHLNSNLKHSTPFLWAMTKIQKVFGVFFLQGKKLTSLGMLFFMKSWLVSTMWLVQCLAPSILGT